MIPNPIRKVLSTFQSCEVRALLMGGQTCVLYRGAEFSGSLRQNAPNPGFVADVYAVHVRLDTQTFYPGTGTGDEARARYSIQYANTNKGVLNLDV